MQAAGRNTGPGCANVRGCGQDLYGRKAMNGAGWLFVLFALGYVAFELYGLHSSKHLMQPDHIYGQFVLADQARLNCGEADEERDARFAHNLDSMRRTAEKDLRKAEPELSAEAAAARVDELEAGRRSEVDALVQSNGCGDRQIWTWLRLYEQRAQMNLP
jgi:hypothetical protein